MKNNGEKNRIKTGKNFDEEKFRKMFGNFREVLDGFDNVAIKTADHFFRISHQKETLKINLILIPLNKDKNVNWSYGT